MKVDNNRGEEYNCIMNDAIRNFLNMNVDYEDTCDYDDGEHIGYIKTTTMSF